MERTMLTRNTACKRHGQLPAKELRLLGLAVLEAVQPHFSQQQGPLPRDILHSATA
jgi:hypothetical protein